MIRSLTIHNPAGTPISWFEKVFPEKERVFRFKPGINVLWGKNGSGKSTLLKCMATMLCCEQGGTPALTEEAIRNLFSTLGRSMSLKELKLEDCVTLSHDGQPTQLVDASATPGIIAGTFDYDFMDAAMMSMARASSGQKHGSRIVHALDDALFGRPPAAIARKVSPGRLNSTWQDWHKRAEKILKGSGKKGQRTILLDEPERSLDIPATIKMWMIIRGLASEVQFIVASHSLFALRLPNTNYIELSPGYIEESAKCLDILAKTWTTEEMEKKCQDGIIRGRKAHKQK
jgi:energy-coupling factor transporter ATP-binding protein EcfA2